jgi:hypothetical protein
MLATETFEAGMVLEVTKSKLKGGICLYADLKGWRHMIKATFFYCCFFVPLTRLCPHFCGSSCLAVKNGRQP